MSNSGVTVNSVIDIRVKSNSSIVKQAEKLGIKIHWKHTVINTNGYKKINSIEIMKQGLVHIIASDTHMAVGQRCYDMELGFTHAKRMIGIEDATMLFSTNPLNILENQKI